MVKLDLLKFALKEGWFKKQVYIFELFGIIEEYTIFDLIDGNLYMKGTDDHIGFFKKGFPLFDIYDEVNLSPGDMTCIKTNIATDIGTALFNYLIVEFGLKGKLPYLNEYVNLKKYVDIVVLNALKVGVIDIDDYNRVSIGITVTRTLSRLFVTADTIKTMQPPPDIIKLREAKIKELKEKYGEDALSDYKNLLELTGYLKELDDKWLDGDPTLTTITKGKVKNVSRVKKYMILGDEQGLTGDGLKAQVVPSSLAEGIEKDPKTIALRFDSARAGAFARGNETKTSGETANIISTAMSNFRVSDIDDCGTTVGRSILVTEQNIDSLSDRTIIKGILKIGNVVTYRTPRRCLIEGDLYCKKCLSKSLAGNKEGIYLMALDVAGMAVDAMLSKMHASELAIYELEIDDL